MTTKIRWSRGKLLESVVSSPENDRPPVVSYQKANLSLSNLHYAKCGLGPPLIIVPATVSKIDNWLGLIQMMGMKNTVYFFELPGHGGSTPFNENFSSDLVAETVESFANHLGLDRFSIMGFSFGGVLTIKTLARLEDRVDNVMLLAPALTKKALMFSRFRLLLLRIFIKLLKVRAIRELFYSIMAHPIASRYLAKIIGNVGKIDTTIPLGQVFNKIGPQTLETLAFQFDELLSLDLSLVQKPFNIPCRFVMSVNDTMLDFGSTLDTARTMFNKIQIHRLYLPFHQPPGTPTFEELNKNYGELLSDDFWTT